MIFGEQRKHFPELSKNLLRSGTLESGDGLLCSSGEVI